MRFAVAGGGVAGLAAALAVARAGHTAIVVERDRVPVQDDPDAAFAVARRGIPHFLQPHAFLPRGRRELRELAPDVLDALRDAGAGRRAEATRLARARRRRPRVPRRSGARRMVAVGDALCHTNPSYAFGLAFALIHASALGRAASAATDGDSLVQAYYEAVTPEARERFAFARDTDAARVRAWKGERLDVGRADGCYPLFAFGPALAAAPHDDHVLRRTIGRIGLLERTSAFDEDHELHRRIERIYAELTATPPAPPGPPREELLALAAAA